MEITSRRQALPTFYTVLLVNLAVFAFFHACHFLLFDERFVQFELRHDWIGDVVVTAFQVALYMPVILFGYLFIQGKGSRAVLLPAALIISPIAYYWQYPVLTGFLYALGQFDPYRRFLFDGMPVIDPFALIN